MDAVINSVGHYIEVGRICVGSEIRNLGNPDTVKRMHTRSSQKLIMEDGVAGRHTVLKTAPPKG